MKKIFIIDDENYILELLKINLEMEGFQVVTSNTGKNVLNILDREKPDLILLDLMLPEINGFDICKKIKSFEKYKNIGIIIISAKSEENDKIVGLEIGADDYITKPFSIKEIIARINAVTRRTSKNSTENKNYIVLDIKNNTILKNGEILELQTKEFNLLKYLIKNKGRVVSRQELLENVWNYDSPSSTRSLDVYIRKLRVKLQDENESIITTIRGQGYKFLNSNS
ncbi:response regulator transcription factor [Fusobacterium sp. MFO224]|uniref:response regulator transcription factor n=1 Tax=Fusobacterium sp. MFO224 TaxID=3378070 RepID=UPI003853AAFF